MKKLLIVALFLFIGLSAVAQETKSVNINGIVTGDTKGFNSIYFYNAGTSIDTVKIINGKFNITLPFSGTYTQLFFTQYEISGNRGYRPFPLLIAGTETITIDLNIADGFYKANISGPNTTVLFNSFLQQQSDVYKKVSDEVAKVEGNGMAPQSTRTGQYSNPLRDSLTKVYMQKFVIDFVTKNKDAFVGIYVLSGAGMGAMDVDKLESMYNIIPANQQQTQEGKKLAAYIRGVRGTKEGASIKSFVLNDPTGKEFSSEQLKGKYVWIDFWASWCGPCKQAFPKMREIYEKYKGKNFEILGISTDSKIESWLKILETIKNPWPQVWDNKNIMSEFAVTAFPTGFLVDPNGKILLKEVGFEPNGEGGIAKKLEEIFGAK